MTAAALRTALSILGLTQAAFAAEIGVSLRTVNGWIAGERRIPGPIHWIVRAMLAAGDPVADPQRLARMVRGPLASRNSRVL